jgi:hypothetical protein
VQSAFPNIVLWTAANELTDNYVPLSWRVSRKEEGNPTAATRRTVIQQRQLGGLNMAARLFLAALLALAVAGPAFADNNGNNANNPPTTSGGGGGGGGNTGDNNQSQPGNQGG